MSALAWAAVGVAALYALHRLATLAEDRGLIYYRRRRGASGSLGNAFLAVQSIVEPSRRHVLEQRLREPSDEADSGDPPRGGA